MDAQIKRLFTSMDVAKARIGNRWSEIAVTLLEGSATVNYNVKKWVMKID